MNIPRQLSVLSLSRALALAFACTLPTMLSITLPTAAVAQTTGLVSEARIASLGVEQLRRLRPGNVLAFRLEGTPGSTVTLQIDGATQTVPLSEVRPGEYAGDYTIRSRDKLTAGSRVTARLVKNGRVTSALLGRSLQQGAKDFAVAAATPITAFTVTAAEGYEPGDELNFSLKGKPGGTASVALQGVDRRIALTEVSRGVYEGGYVLRRQDRLPDDMVVDGFLMSDRRETSQRIERRIGRAAINDAPNNARNDARENRPQPAAACANCGVIESVKVVEVKGDSPNAIGTIAGGVLGGVLGHQVGGGSGKDLATIVGAIGGAYAGNRVENNMDKSKVYRVTVRMQGGTTQDFDYANDPAVQAGTRVRVENGVLIRL